MRTLKVRVRDETASAVLVCFNRPFLESQLPVGSQGCRHRQVRATATGTSSPRPSTIESLGEDGAPSSGMLPVYPLTEGLNQGQVRRIVKAAIAEYGAKVEDELPAVLRETQSLMPKREALRAIHFPVGDGGARRGAREPRLRGALLFPGRRRPGGRCAAARPRSSAEPRRGLLKRRLIERLPFELTSGQVEAAAEIAADMASPRPMARLLQGDVGSGKTLVAFLACLDAIEAGGQAAIMAPTELLARQHAATAARLLEPLGVRLGFLSGNVDDAARAPLLAALKSGEVDLVLGHPGPLLRRRGVQEPQTRPSSTSSIASACSSASRSRARAPCPTSS